MLPLILIYYTRCDTSKIINLNVSHLIYRVNSFAVIFQISWTKYVLFLFFFFLSFFSFYYTVLETSQTQLANPFKGIWAKSQTQLSLWMCLTLLPSGKKHLSTCDLIIYRMLFSSQAGSCNRNVLKTMTHQGMLGHR